MDGGGALDDDEERALRRCPVLYPPSGTSTDAALAEIDAALTRDRFATVDNPLRASDFAHARAADYPGGIVWISHRGSSRKEAAADVVEALDLPTTSWLHSPLHNEDDARKAMWHGLSLRPRALVILDGWPEWETPATWTPDGASTHVIAITDSNSAGASDIVDFVEPAFAKLSPNARTLLMVLSCLGPTPVLASTTRALWNCINDGASTSEETCANELVDSGLARRTTLGELAATAPVLTKVRALDGGAAPLWEPVAQTLAEALAPLTPSHVHKSRRLVRSASHAASFLEGRVLPKTYDALLTSLARCPREFEATEAAKKRSAYAVRYGTLSDRDLLPIQLDLAIALSSSRDFVGAQDVLRAAVPVAERLHGVHAVEVADICDAVEDALALAPAGARPLEKH